MIDFSSFSRKYRIVLITYVQILVLGILWLCFRDNVDIALTVNRINAPFWDYFFKYWTEFGNLALIAPIILFQCYIKFRYALIAVVSSLIGFLIVQIGKHLIWFDSPRPKFFFEKMHDIHYVAGVHLNSMHSFPSGHTAGAFGLFMALAFINRRPVYQVLFLIFAVLVGYSRMYLSQHFLVDVLVGSLIGTISAIISYFLFKDKKGVLDDSLRTIFKRSRESLR